ncbi:putative tetratricopeptide-like helical domain-containing protein [Medicago truncatula]|nr:putative pentatricopeptide repeat-containing protein At1g77010, mitochondrial [Medicago truncatula]XP_039685183.1 putative pentatricopeptide repeat-containing protein At1g77010, mitochondrial [Medicago truncatula]XP_039685184.1 putative pentatricopeptide repeat-containing protein At1g77010, mitochondrial [Medicago truncatula]XP_039685185.1 putative pentatricopeptide repeat-containing protein At1g77010, mitochondrial [Medicago truncatula]XP_039685186.1 putative pentatricopeptide repeat-contai
MTMELHSVCRTIREARQLHLSLLKTGNLHSSVITTNRLLQLYSRRGSLHDASKLFDEMPQPNPFSWNTLIEAHINLGHRNKSLELFHAMPHKTHYSWNLIVSTLSKSGDLQQAQALFNAMPMKNPLVWNSMIHGYSRHGYPRNSLLLFKEMNLDPLETVHRDAFVLSTVFGACADLFALDCGKQVHARVFIDGFEFEQDKVLCSSIVNFYGKCGDLDSAARVVGFVKEVDDFSLSALVSGYANAGRMSDARKVFDNKVDPCSVLWNSIISGYVSNGEEMEALALFNKMRRNGVWGDFSAVANILSISSSLLNVELVKQMHDHAFKIGATHDIVVASTLLDAYSKCQHPHDSCKLFHELKVYDAILLNTMITVYCNCGRVEDAKEVFNSMPNKTLISWNSILVGLTQNACPSEALDTFSMMNKLDVKMDKFSFASVISACAIKSSLELGEQLFGKAITLGLESDQIICTSLVDFYCKCGLVEMGRKVFDGMIKTDEVSWNTMLMGYATNGYGIEALTLFNEMGYSGVRPSAITFTGILSACDHCGLVEEGRDLFRTMKHDYDINPGIEHYSCMVDLFARVGCFGEAMYLIEEMPFQADANMWLSVLRGCVSHGNKTIGKMAAEKIIQLDPGNSGAYIQLSNILATSEDWEGSAEVRELMRNKNVQKIPGCSWMDC